MPYDNPDVSDRKSPGFWFYPSDFEKDVQMLSLASQGLWIRMLGWMHENESHRGFLELPNGIQMTDKHIAAKVGKPLSQVRACLEEMASLGIFSRVGDSGTVQDVDRDTGGGSTGTLSGVGLGIYCRRMARDTHISTVRREAAKSRAIKARRAENGSFAGEFAGANHPAKSQQNPTVTAPVPDSVFKQPPYPPNPPNGNGHHKPTSPLSLPAVAGEIFERHPPIRRDCSRAQVEKKLAAILKHKRIPVAQSDEYLGRLNRNHAAACLSPNWAKEDGQFAKSLENWLAPTKERYEVEPQPHASPGPPRHAIL